MTQGFIVVVVGIALIYLVLSGKLDCLIAAFRACASGASNAATPAAASSKLPTQGVLSNVLSETI